MAEIVVSQRTERTTTSIKGGDTLVQAFTTPSTPCRSAYLAQSSSGGIGGTTHRAIYSDADLTNAVWQSDGPASGGSAKSPSWDCPTQVEKGHIVLQANTPYWFAVTWDEQYPNYSIAGDYNLGMPVHTGSDDPHGHKKHNPHS